MPRSRPPAVHLARSLVLALAALGHACAPPDTLELGAGPPAGGDAARGAAATSAVTWGSDADYPYILTNNDEPFRGQFHVTAPAGWLNDVNGVWYLGGTYHLAYQAYPYALEAPGDTKFWGHATSPDLVHWTHWPIMLHPGVNVPGSAWSGSTVVDTDNTSGLRSGQNPVLVTIYTATSIGTAVAYSNDLGLTWQAYAGNPVAIGGRDPSTRDPHVFWHAATRRWICVYYENGISFYASPDLKTWTRVSHIDFGFECPDLYELPVDGNPANRRWVLQDASGTYLVGSFDGTTFVPDGSGSHKLDASPQFYAAQTFYRPTFPDARVVQMAWIRGMDRATAPWNQAISFPAELKLETRPEGVRVTRTPVAEIASLYGAKLHWGRQLVPGGSNLLQGIESRTYDLEIVVDLAASAARTIQLKLGSQTVVYDVAARSLLGSPLAPIDGKLALRVLVDWGQLEVFGNRGSFSYTAAVPFSPTDTSVALIADGALSVASADFRVLRRIWPGQPALSSKIIDDADSGIAYTGAWLVSNEDRYFGGTCHVTWDAGNAVAATFTGTRVEWYGLKNVDLGRADVYIDGVLAASGIDCYSPTRQNVRLFSQGGLANEPHTIKVVAAGTKADASAGTALVHDYFVRYVDP